MTTDQSVKTNDKFRWFHLTPGRLLVVLLAVEGILLLSERWFPKGWAVLIAIASIGVTMLVLLLWFVLALVFHWRFQFSIRSLLMLTIGVAIPFSWLGVGIKAAREQRETVEALTKDGGMVHYDDEYDKSAYSLALVWMREQLGDDFFGNVATLDLRNTKVSHVGVEHLKGLTQLHKLYLENTKITNEGVERLKGLTQLRTLDLCATKVGDVGLEHLKGLTQLRELNLYYTKVTDVGVEHLKGLTQLQWLNLIHTKVSDIGVEHLKGLTQLQVLHLYDTKVTDAGVAKLQKSLPNCKIVH